VDKWTVYLRFSLLCAALCMAGTTASAMKDVSVHDYRARGNDYGDDTAAFQKALNEVIAAGGGKIFIPPGDYIISKRLEIIAPKKAPNIKLALVGAGRGESRLMSHSTEGLLRFESEHNGMDLTVRDLSLMAGKPAAGIALEITNPVLGVRVERGVLLERVEVAGIYPDCYFNVGISMFGQWRPLLRDVTVSGAISDAMTDDSPAFKMEIGIRQNGFYGGEFANCHVSYCHTAYSWIAEENGEGFVIRHSTADFCRVGAVIATPEQEPGGCLVRSRIRARDVGLRIDHKRLLTVVDNEFQPLSKAGEYPYTDVTVSNSWAIQINRNRFIGSPKNRTHVRVDGRGEPKEYVIMPFTRFVQIHDNEFCLPPDRALQYSGDDIFGVYLNNNSQNRGE
jgi:hypothetical protein